MPQRLAVLGETVEVRSEHAGVVTEVLARAGDLAQYDTPLLRMAPGVSAGRHGAPDQ